MTRVRQLASVFITDSSFPDRLLTALMDLMKFSLIKQSQAVYALKTNKCSGDNHIFTMQFTNQIAQNEVLVH